MTLEFDVNGYKTSLTTTDNMKVVVQKALGTVQKLTGLDPKTVTEVVRTYATGLGVKRLA